MDEIVKLVGIDAISPSDRLIMETARSIREDFLQQNAFVTEDAFTSMEKQNVILKLVLAYYKKASEALTAGADLDVLTELPVRERIARAKEIHEDAIHVEYKRIMSMLDEQISAAINNKKEDALR